MVLELTSRLVISILKRNVKISLSSPDSIGPKWKPTLVQHRAAISILCQAVAPKYVIQNTRTEDNNALKIARGLQPTFQQSQNFSKMLKWHAWISIT